MNFSIPSTSMSGIPNSAGLSSGIKIHNVGNIIFVS